MKTAPKRTDKKAGIIDWEDYHSSEEINFFVDELARQYEFVSNVSVGQSFEGREMKVIAIEKAGPGAPNIFIEASQHAREWIANAVATYLAYELVENYDNHPIYADTFNIHILPMENPDGYEFTRSNVSPYFLFN